METFIQERFAMVVDVVAMKRRPYLQKTLKLHGAKTLFYKCTSLPVNLQLASAIKIKHLCEQNESFGGVKLKPQTHEMHWPPLLYSPLLPTVIFILIIHNL